MLNKILLLSIITSLSACESINQSKQCDADKNYIISNPDAIKEYQKLKADGKIKSYYYNNLKQEECNEDKCVRFNAKDYDFVEMNFNDKLRKGVYTIRQFDDLERRDCIDNYKSSFTTNKNLKCYVITKNENNIINSDYELTFIPVDNGVTKLEFKNIKINKSLFKISYQTYSTGAIGGPGGGICPQAYINHPEFKFNPYAFP